MTRRYKVLMLGPLLAVLLAVGYQFSRRPVSAQSISGPQQWVAFTADVLINQHGHEVHGRFARNADGSTSTEMFSPFGNGSVVTIHNFQTLMTYYRAEDHTWAQMRLPPSMPRTPTQSLLVPRGQMPTEETAQGMRVLRLVNVKRQTLLKAPDLNFFELFVDTGGMQTTYMNVRLELPPADLFLPPADTPVRTAKTIRGLFNAFADLQP